MGKTPWNFYLGRILLHHWIVFPSVAFTAFGEVAPVIYSSPEVISSVSDAKICCYGNNYYFRRQKDNGFMHNLMK